MKMNMNPTGSRMRRSGHTLIELMVAMLVYGLLMTAVINMFVVIFNQSKAGAAQVRHMANARRIEQVVLRAVQDGKAISVVSNTLYILKPGSSTYSSFSYRDTDGKSSTVTNNFFIYDPDIDVASNEIVVCSDISPIGTQTIFSTRAVSPMAATLTFHLGESTNAYVNPAYTLFGKTMGIRGVEVRFSATPRNLQYWYQ